MINRMKSLLNYWMLRGKSDAKFVGFANLDPDSNIGLEGKDEENIIPLFIFFNDAGWGDSEPTSKKFPWVLYASGNDDFSCYMLFGTEDAAIKVAKHYVENDVSLSPFGSYKDRKWQSQN